MVPIIFLGKWGHFQKSVWKIWDIWGKKGHILKVIFSKDKLQLLYIQVLKDYYIKHFPDVHSLYFDMTLYKSKNEVVYLLAILNGIRKADCVAHKQWHIFCGRFTKFAVSHNLTFVVCTLKVEKLPDILEHLAISILSLSLVFSVCQVLATPNIFHLL